MSDSPQMFTLEDGSSALILSRDGSSCSVRSALCPDCAGSECGIPESLTLVTTMAMLIDHDPRFRSWLADQARDMVQGTYLPLSFRKDLH